MVHVPTAIKRKMGCDCDRATPAAISVCVNSNFDNLYIKRNFHSKYHTICNLQHLRLIIYSLTLEYVKYVMTRIE